MCSKSMDAERRRLDAQRRRFILVLPVKPPGHNKKRRLREKTAQRHVVFLGRAESRCAGFEDPGREASWWR